jgi:hypothetical protein
MSVVLAATVATAGAPDGLTTAIAPERISALHALDLSAPRAGPVSEHGRLLRFDQSHGSSATADEETLHFANDGLIVGMRPQPIVVIHWQRTEPDLLRIARNLRHNGLPVVSLWRSGRSLFALGLSPRGVPGLYFTQKARD